MNAPGVLALSGGAGSVETIGSLAGSGTITLTDHTLAVGTNNQSTVFSGTIGGTAAFLTKHGTGTLTLTGNSDTMDGTTFISGGGGLIVNGTLSASVFPQAGLLGGSGTVGNISASTGIGTIAPGPGIGGAGTGILSTSGLTLGGAMTVAIDLNAPMAGAGDHRVAAANQAVIGNAALVLTRGYTPRPERHVHHHRQRERVSRRRHVRRTAAERAPVRGRPPVPRFLHRRRRQRRRAHGARAAGVLDRRRHRDRGRQRLGQRRLHRQHAERAVPDRRRAVRDGERHGDEPVRLHRAQRHADVPAGHDESDRDDLRER